MADCGWFWSILWVIILLVFGWPIGFICAVFYCLLSPFAACCHGCNELVNLLERGVKLPLTCAQNMVSGKSMCWCWMHLVVEMKIWIYWSKSNFLIYFHIVLNKNWKFYWSWAGGPLLIARTVRGIIKWIWWCIQVKKF